MLTLPRRIYGMTDLLCCVDLHIGNMVFATPDINSHTIDELYAAMGSPSRLSPVSSSGTRHHPQRQVIPPSVSYMWSFCNSLVPGSSVCLIDFGESFHVPFSHDHPFPGTPAHFAAPELLMPFPSEITTSINIGRPHASSGNCSAVTAYFLHHGIREASFWRI